MAAGIERNDDFNGAEQVGAGFYQVSQRRGRRWTTADGYLRPARRRPNLTVLTKTHVLGVRISQGRAVGVDVARGSAREFLRAEREVVLSAGALNTPQLLMLSGIGPADLHGQLRNFREEQTCSPPTLPSVAGSSTRGRVTRHRRCS